MLKKILFLHNFHFFVKTILDHTNKGRIFSVKRKVLMATAALVTLILTAYHRPSEHVDDINSASSISYPLKRDDLENHVTADPHYDYVNQLGFTNIVNTTGDSYYRKYRLNSRNAAENDVFHGWRHTWVEPNDYVDKEIEVYRYTGDYNGQNRTIHIVSYYGTPIGGYHFGNGETVEHAKMVEHEGSFSRVADDFRETWNDLFDIRR